VWLLLKLCVALDATAEEQILLTNDLPDTYTEAPVTDSARHDFPPEFQGTPEPKPFDSYVAKSSFTRRLAIVAIILFDLLILPELISTSVSRLHQKLQADSMRTASSEGVFNDTSLSDWGVLVRSAAGKRGCCSQALCQRLPMKRNFSRGACFFLDTATENMCVPRYIVVPVFNAPWRYLVKAKLHELAISNEMREKLSTADWMIDGKVLLDTHKVADLREGTLRRQAHGLRGGGRARSLQSPVVRHEIPYDLMSVTDLRKLASSTPGVARTAQDSQGKHQNKKKPALVAEFKALCGCASCHGDLDDIPATEGDASEAQPLAGSSSTDVPMNEDISCVRSSPRDTLQSLASHRELPILDDMPATEGDALEAQPLPACSSTDSPMNGDISSVRPSARDSLQSLASLRGLPIRDGSGRKNNGSIGE
jgi:hypothetical protein